MGSNDSESHPTKGDCDSRHKTMRWVTSGLVLFGLAALGSIGGVALSASVTANGVAAKQEAREKRIDELYKDVREIRDTVRRIEKNGGH